MSQNYEKIEHSPYMKYFPLASSAGCSSEADALGERRLGYLKIEHQKLLQT
jgi:hypothetical protein